MMLLGFGKRKVSYRVQLSLVARILGYSPEELLGVLKGAGFVMPYGILTSLDESHLSFLAKKYVGSVKSFYAKLKKKHHELSDSDQRLFRDFFVKFIKRKRFGFFLYESHDNQNDTYEEVLEKVYIDNLDENLIEDFFYDLVERTYLQSLDQSTSYKDSKEFEGSYQKIKHRIRLKLKLKKSFSDIRFGLHSILVCNHYHIFSDDENENGEVKQRVCFSGIINSSREAFNYYNNFKQIKKWKKILNPL